MSSFQNYIIHCCQRVLFKVLPNLRPLKDGCYNFDFIKDKLISSTVSDKARLNGPYRIVNSIIKDYTYISQNSSIFFTEIGSFCSIGPNFISGWGVHPTTGVSTSPMFYSTKKQNGTTLTKTNKIDENPPNTIGNDVFIGSNVVLLNGISIGDGVVIGAGSVVTKDVPPYAIVAGIPAKIIRYRFEDEIINNFLKVQWWNKSLVDLEKVEKHFFDIEFFLQTQIKSMK